MEEYGIAETIKVARPDAVEFEELKIPERFYPTGGHAKESWRSMFYANLIADFIDEILAGGDRNQGNFDDGAAVQEVDQRRRAVVPGAAVGRPAAGAIRRWFQEPSAVVKATY